MLGDVTTQELGLACTHTLAPSSGAVVQYDVVAKRWFMVSPFLDDAGTKGSAAAGLCIFVSLKTNPLLGWQAYSIPTQARSK